MVSAFDFIVYQPMKIISGGQTGADLGGLVAGKRLNIQTGGIAPKGYKTENGQQEEHLTSFGLLEHASPSYKARTLENVKNSDATLIFSKKINSSGTTATVKFCEQENKPYCLLVNLDAKDMRTASIFLNSEKPKIINVAGNRESVSPGIASEVAAFLVTLLTDMR